MEIDGVEIADDGRFSFRGDERIGAEHLFGSPNYPYFALLLLILT
jgi:hypothetical protein